MKARILIIGGDKKIIPLIDTLRGIGGTNLAGVYDAGKTQEGFLYAKKLNIDVFTSIARALARAKPDIIIETSASREFRKTLSKMSGRKIKIIDLEAARLLLEVAEQKEKEVERMKSEFVSATSHEFRTPLAAIKESVMLIMDGMTGSVSAEQRRFLDIARKNINRLADLINDLMDVSRIETGIMELNKEICDISDLMEKALESMKSLAEKSKLDLVYTLSKGLPRVKCDRERIRQVVINLVANAIKFTPEGGRVNVKLTRHQRAEGKEFVIITVRDTGIGIEEKDLSRIFAKFGQLNTSLTRKFAGTGLGLVISKAIIKMHGGEIWVESKPGKGSMFSFTLPVK